MPQTTKLQTSTKKILEILAFLWALPVTLVGFMAVLLCGGWAWSFQFRWQGRLALVMGPRWMWMFPKWVAAVTLGSVILVRDRADMEAGQQNPSVLLLHELEHVRQCCILGPFMLVLYPLASFLAWLLYRELYRGNYFEIKARIQTDQTRKRP